MAHMVTRIPITPGDLTDQKWGTDDAIAGDVNTNILIGDAGGSIFDFSRGGNDSFTWVGPFDSAEPTAIVDILMQCGTPLASALEEGLAARRKSVAR